MILMIYVIGLLFTGGILLVIVDDEVTNGSSIRYFSSFNLALALVAWPIALGIIVGEELKKKPPTIKAGDS